MVDIRGFNGGMNTDAAPELLKPGDYTYAMNVSNGTEGITNLLGNRLLPGAPPPSSGSEWVCGSHFDKTRQRIIYFTYNTLGYHRIISVNVSDNTHTVLFEDNPVQNPILQNITESRVMIINSLTNPQNLFIIEGSNLELTVGSTFTISGSVFNNATFTVTAFDYSLNVSGTSFVNNVYVSQNTTFELGTFTITYDKVTGFTSGVFNWPTYLYYEPTARIKDIKIIHREYEGDLVYFVDLNKMLLKFNYDTLLNGGYGSTISLDYFKVIKAPPKEVAVVDIIDDANYNVNNLYKKLFQFKYRYVYDDNEKSVWSALSKVPIPANSTNAQINSQGGVQNCIDIKINTGDINIKKIEISGRLNIEDNWSDFFLVDTLDKDKLSISDNTFYTYKFRNNSVYTPIDIQESNLLFDYVPDEVNALELANGNTIVVGGLKDGFDRDTNLDVDITPGYNLNSPAVLSTLSAEVRNASNTGAFTSVEFNNSFLPYGQWVAGRINFTGIPQVGDEVTITINGINIEKWRDWIQTVHFTQRSINWTYKITFQAGWSISDLVNAFNNYPSIPSSYNVTADNGFFGLPSSRPSKPFGVPTGAVDPNTLYFGSFVPGLPIDTKKWVIYSVSVSVKKSFSFGESDVFPMYKWNGLYKFGIAYYNKDGKTNGVYTNDNLTFQSNLYNSVGVWQPGVLPETPSCLISIGHEPPEWADYYHIVRTKELSCDLSLMVVSSNFRREGGYMYLDIQNIKATNTLNPETSKVLNYTSATFVEGDRVRILQKLGSWNFGIPIDTEILAVVDYPNVAGRQSLKLKVINNQPSHVPINNNDKLIIEIYRPAKVLSDEELTFYEIGYKYNIYTDLSGNKYHEGNKQTQTSSQDAIIDMYFDGDYYYKARVMVSDVNNTSTSTLYVSDRNFSETYFSAVWSQGRPLIVDEDIKEEYYPAMLRFSQSYIYGTNINNLSRFYPNNFEEADASFGDILRLKTRENFIRLFQRYKVGMIPIYRQVIIDNANSSQVALSERLLNKPNYYNGEYGIDKYGSSLVSTDYGDYFIDTNNKAIVRVSLDGITNISDTNNLSVWSNQNISENSYGFGCFNYENRNVIMFIGVYTFVPIFNTFLVENKIVAYSESDKNFESFYGFTSAQDILFINGFIYSLYVNPAAQVNQGWHVYIHDNPVRNNFFGQQQSSSVTTVFNGAVQAKKTYTAIEELANGLWTGTITTGPLTNQESNITQADFQKVAGAFAINSKENKFNATIKRDVNSPGGKYLGAPMKGLYAQVALTNSLTTEQRLISVSLKYIPSPLTNS
jgi:hypothetical protein